VWFKCENSSARGRSRSAARNVRIARLTERSGERRRRRGAGNHAQGVALAASMLGTTATVFMPVGAPAAEGSPPRRRTREGRATDSPSTEALAAARSTPSSAQRVIHPFDHPDIIAGQGTTGLEILDQVPDVQTVVVPTGGGGLVSGVAAAVKARRPDAASSRCRPRAPRRTRSRSRSAARSAERHGDDRRRHRGRLPRQRHVAPCEQARSTTSSRSPTRAISRALLKVPANAPSSVVGPGVAAVAALMEEPAAFRATGRRGPLRRQRSDPLLMLRVIRHGLHRAGRYLSFGCASPTDPASWAKLLGVLADSGANVLDVEHQRTGPKLHLDEVEVALQLETRGPNHCDEVLTRLRAEGYPLAFG